MPAVAIPIFAAATAYGVATSAAVLAFVGGSTFLAAVAGGIAATAVSFAGNAAFGPKAKAAMSGRSVMVRQPTVSRKIVYGQVRVSGPILYMTTTQANANLRLVVALAGHEVEAVGDIYLDDNLVLGESDPGTVVTSGRFSNHARFHRWTGSPDQLADSFLVTESGGQWTEAHRLRGVAYLYASLAWSQDVYPNGLPNISAVVKGRKVYDPRTLTTAYSTNAALCIRDYLTDAKYGLGVSAAEIDEVNFAAQANICDEIIPLNGGGSEPRYTINGVIDTAQRPQAVLEQLLTACGGRLVYSGGKWRLYVGAYRNPTVTLSEDDLRGPMRVQARVSRRDLFNAVKGVYVSPLDDYQPTDYPAYTSPTFEAEDGGERIFRDLDLPFTTSAATAQRLAKMELFRAREQITVTLPCKLTAFRVQAGDVVNLTNARMGWTAKPFEVVDWRLTFAGEELGVDLTLRETSATVYDWSASDQQLVAAAPATALPDPYSIAAPTGLTLTPRTSQQPDGTIVSEILATWSAPDDAFLYEYEVNFRVSGTTDWVVAVPARGPSTLLTPLVPGVGYDVRVRAVNAIGVRSAWVSTSATAINDVTAPGVPANLTALGAYRSIILAWANPSDTDLAVVEVYRNTTNNSGTAVKVWEGLASTFRDDGLENSATRHYWLKARDWTGNRSAFSAGVSATTLATVPDNGYQLTLTNEAHVLPADVAGNVSSFAGAVTTAYVFKGPVDETSSWSVTGTGANCTFTQAGTTFTVTALSADSGYIDITATKSGETPLVRRFSLAKAKAGATGANGAAGANGTRGSIHAFRTIVGASWSNAEADAAITSLGLTKVFLDRVTLSNSGAGFSQTRYWDGSAWVIVNEVIDGNLVVTGTLATSKLQAGTMTGFTINTAGSGTRLELRASDNTLKAYSGSTETLTLNGSTATLRMTPTASIYAIDISGSSGIALMRLSNTGGVGLTITNATIGIDTNGGTMTTGGRFNGAATGAIGIGSGSGGVGVSGQGNLSNGVGVYGTAGSFAVQGEGGTRGGYFTGTQFGVECAGPTGIRAVSNSGAIGVDGTGGTAGVKGTGTTVGVQGSGGTYDFEATGAGGNYGPFTGSHDGLLLKTAAGEPGDILVDLTLVRRRSISSTLFEVGVSTAPTQPAIGVLVKRQWLVAAAVMGGGHIPATIADEGAIAPGFEGYQDSHDSVVFNALGEGQVSVCGEGGDIAAGDLIVTSSMPGKGMRQADGVIRNTTVAKAREGVAFAHPGEVKQIACIYLCG